jgi:sporulation protein YlmC with PRC-barrel domain
MGEAMQFTIGVEVSGSDGVCGELIRVVVDPIARAVTHLVVEPPHRQGLGRLVPLELVAGTEDGDGNGIGITLTCTLVEFEALPRAEETHFLPGGGFFPGYQPAAVLALPYYGLGVGNVSPPVTVDTLPVGEVGVRRGQSVHATDGEIGRVQGLVINPANHHVTHVLLQEGHLWGRKEVAIPIGAVTAIDEGISLNLTKENVHDLPAVDVDHPTGGDPA